MADSPIPAELEAKLLVPRETDLRVIARLTHLGAHPLRPRGAVRLHSTYLDTPSLTLAHHGVALRLRRQGRRWEATAKWAGHAQGAIHERPELTVPLSTAPRLPFMLPPGPLHTQLAALAAGRALSPILISETYRRLFDVLPPDPNAAHEPVAELALDRVSLRAPQDGGQETAYCEVEIERRQGDRRDITSLARLMRRSFHLVPSAESKFARGLMLIYGTDIMTTATARVLAYDTVHEAARHVLAQHLHRLRVHDPGARTGEDPEALHDMRVATRRLRAAVHLFEAGIPARLQNRLNEELHWLGELLGRVRDLDVQLAKLDSFTAGAPSGFRSALGELHAYLNAERARCRAEMLGALDTERYFRLLLQLERLAYARTQGRRQNTPAQEPVVVAAERAIQKAFRRLLKRGEKIHARPHPEDFHALRIRAKRLRYLLEFLQELTGKAGRRLVKRLTVLQDLLGSYHDAVVAADLVRTYVEGPGAQLGPSQVVALGALVGSELRLAEKQRAEFEDTWRRLTRARTLRDCSVVLRHLRRMQVPVLAAAPATAASGESA